MRVHMYIPMYLCDVNVIGSCQQGAIHCPYYMKTGACKYGAACKFDHPPPGEVMATTQETSTSVEAQENEAETAQE